MKKWHLTFGEGCDCTPRNPPPKYPTGEPWFKSNFKLDIPNYTITRRDRLSWQGGGVAILVRNDIKFDIIDSCSTTNTYIEAIIIFLKNTQNIIYQQSIFHQHPLLIKHK